MFPPLDALAERRLVDRCLSRVEAAWTEMVARYAPILRHVLLGTLDAGKRDSGRVDDLLQDLWLALMNDQCRQLRKFDEHRGSLQVFLILQAREQARRSWRQPRLVTSRLCFSDTNKGDSVAGDERDDGGSAAGRKRG